MAEREIIHEHNNTTHESSNYGMLVGIMLVIAVLVLFFIYGLPALQSNGGVNVQIPDQMDVNVNSDQK